MFETGVSKYVKGVCEIEAFFPVDNRGISHISCQHCRFYTGKYRCGINREICDFPDKYRGANCPLKVEGVDE